jgi:glycosyltransferase involved in cell wall biosynthesis
MKIVHLINYYMPGLGYQDNFLPYCQQKLGHEVYIITSDRYYPYHDYERLFSDVLGERISGPGETADKGIKIFKLTAGFENTRHKLLKMDRTELLQLLRKLDPEIILVHDYKNLNVLTARDHCLKTKCRLFIDCHSDDQNSLVGRPLSRKIIYNPLLRAWYKNKVVNYASKFIAINRASERFLAENFGVPKEKIVINRLGVDTELFKFSDVDRKEMRAELNLADSDMVFVSSGKFMGESRSGLLFEAFKVIEEKYPLAKLLLVGKIEDRLKSLFGALKNMIFVDFLPHRDLPAYYSAADVSVWTSATVSMLDAMANGRPMVYYNEENTKYLQDNGIGLVYNSVPELVKCLENFLANRDTLAASGQKGLDYVSKNFSWEQIARQSISIYKGEV